MLKNFISKIQNSEDAVKKIWLFVFSGASMAIVVSLWVVYMDAVVARVDSPANAPVLAQQEEKIDNGPGFFAIFGAGVKTIYDELKERLSVKNSIVIENQERNFVAESVEPLPKTKLSN